MKDIDRYTWYDAKNEEVIPEEEIKDLYSERFIFFSKQLLELSKGKALTIFREPEPNINLHHQVMTESEAFNYAKKLLSRLPEEDVYLLELYFHRELPDV